MKKLLAVAFVVAVALLLSSSALAVPSTFQSPLSYSIYVPLVDAPPCADNWAGMELYATASSPIVHIGEVVTFTMAVYNNGCGEFGLMLPRAYVNDTPILSPTSVRHIPLGGIWAGQYQTSEFSFLAIGSGAVTTTLQVTFEPCIACNGGMGTDVPIRVVP